MRILFLLGDNLLRNSLLAHYSATGPGDELAVVKIPLVLKGEGGHHF